MSRFYVTLPSNSSIEYYPDNTVACYTTKLVDKIELEGEWEVGLAEISIPTAVDNVVHGRCYYDIYLNNRLARRITLPAGNHKHVHTLIQAMHDEQRSQIPLQSDEVLFVEFCHGSSKISMNFMEEKDRHITVQFSADLALMLGLDEDVIYSDSTTTQPTSLDAANLHSVYVYCDILEHVAVGDTKAPLLRIVDKPDKSTGNVHKIMNPILYVPLQKKNFDTVEIRIMTDTGMPVPFRSGKAFVVLEFRRSLHAYFGL